MICLVIAYPVAYAIALHGGRYKNALIALMVVPFFASYLIRMYAWKTLLSDDGMLITGLRRPRRVRELSHSRHAVRR